MAEEKKAIAETAKKEVKAAAKKPGFWAKCKQFGIKIGKSFKNMWYELKKVTWPSKRKWLVYSVIVLAVMLIMSVIVGLFDLGASALVRELGKIFG